MWGGGYGRWGFGSVWKIALDNIATVTAPPLRPYSQLHNYCIQHNTSWEADRFSASQEIPHILCNPEVHYRIHKCQASVPILSQINPVHTQTSQFMMIYLNIVLPSAPGYPKWPFSLRFPHQTLYTSLLLHTLYMSRPSLIDFNTKTILGENYRSLSSSLCSFLHSSLPRPS